MNEHHWFYAGSKRAVFCNVCREQCGGLGNKSLACEGGCWVELPVDRTQLLIRFPHSLRLPRARRVRGGGSDRLQVDGI